ncbi:MAG: hypothetical protein A2X52_17170 [Candidatus Rokubacteria bacterium GWC2_70_16]|nr:MAG: hypothetical protein A2X52_17170 [Candidatus Rokubacteria bacterium GWC2_70_16]
MRSVRFGLRARLFLLVVLAVVPALGVIVYTAAEQRRAMLGAAQESAASMAHDVAMGHERLVEGARQLLVGLAQLPEIRRNDDKACAPIFARLLVQLPAYVNVVATRPDGTLFCSAVPPGRPVSFADRPWWQETVKTGNLAVGRYALGRITGKPMLSLAYPAVESSGALRAVVGVGLDLAALERLIAAMRLPVGAAVLLIDRDGVVLARHPEVATLRGKNVADTPLFKAIAARPGGGTLRAMGLDGHPRLFAHAPLRVEGRDAQVHVAVGIQEAVAVAEVDRVLARNVTLLGLSTLFALLVASFGGAAMLLRPIRRLLGASRRLRAGDTGARVGAPYGGEELGELGRDFDATAARLEERERELRAAHAELERRVEERTQELRAVVEASPLGIWALSPEGVIGTWNAAAERIFGWSAAEVLGRPNPTVPADLQDEFRGLIDRVLSGDTLTDIETRRLRRDGMLIDVSLSMAPLRDAGGAIAGTVAVLADITASKELEAQLRQSQKMEGIGRLAGGIAHDFNNLLTVISGRTDLLAEALGQQSPLRRHVDSIRNVAERATGLTRQLLAFSRRQALQPRVVDLNAATQGMHEVLGRLIGEDIDLVTVLGPALGRVKVDPSQMEQVILNLVVNARQAMPEGGRLTIETGNVELGEEYARTHAEVEPGRYVMLAVTDTGHGMDAGTKARIFEPFFTTRGPGQGTGLGLATVYGIVKQHGGHIWVYSEPGRGTTFKIYLPRVEETAEEAAPAALEALPRGSETILLVEDEEEVRALARETLEAGGYRVLEAASPHEALRLAQEHDGPIHLIVSDVVMPEMSGRALVDRLAALRPDARVLYMSGYTENAIVHQGVLDPSIAFLQKPFTPGALARKVREVLGPPPGDPPASIV